MAWKLRKDKLPTDDTAQDEQEPQGSEVAEAMTTPPEADLEPVSEWNLEDSEHSRPVFDLGGSEGTSSLSDWQMKTPAEPVAEPEPDLTFQDDEEEAAPIVLEESAPEPVAPPSPIASVPPISIPQVAPFIVDAPPQAPPTMDRHLLLRIGNLSATYPLVKDITIIGRPDSALHYYPDIEIELDDAVSRRHAEVLRRGDTYFLVDEGSTNGTMLNGETLPPHQERQLERGDRIRVGERTEIIFE